MSSRFPDLFDRIVGFAGEAITRETSRSDDGGGAAVPKGVADGVGVAGAPERLPAFVRLW